MLLRIVKREASFEEEDAETLLETEFLQRDGSLDLNLSAYITSEERLAQLRCEHCAGANLGGPSACQGLDVESLHEMIDATPGNKWFDYADKAHRELRFAGRDGLLEFASKLVRSDRAARTRAVEKTTCVRYLKSVRDDSEWLAFFDRHEKGAEWRKLANKTQTP